MKKISSKHLNFIIWFLGTTLGFFGLFYGFKYVSPFIIGGGLAYLLIPIGNKAKNKIKNPNLNAALLTFLAYVIGVGAMLQVLALIAFQLTDLAIDFQTNSNLWLQPMIASFNVLVSENTWLEAFLSPEKILESLSSMISSLSTVGLKTIINSFSSFIYWTTVGIFSIFITFYTLKEGIDENSTFRKFVEKDSSFASSKTKIILDDILKTIGKTILSYGFLFGLTFLVTCIGFSILRLPYSILLGFTCMILNIIPIVGTSLLFVILIGVFAIQKMWVVVAGLIIIFISDQITQRIMEPKILSGVFNIHPLLSLGTVFIGIQLGGVLGILYLFSLILTYQTLNKLEFFR